MLDRIGETVDREIRTLARSIDREEPEASDAKSVKIHVVAAELLSGQFRCGVRGEGLKERQILAEGNRFRQTVDRGTGGEEDLAASRETRCLQHMEGAGDVGVDVELGIQDRGAHPGASGQVDDGIRLHLFKEVPDSIPIPEIDFGYPDPIGKRGHIGPLDRGIIEIIEVVHDRHGMPLSDQGSNHMRAYESGPSGDDDLHGGRIYPTRLTGIKGIKEAFFLEGMGLFRKGILRHDPPMPKKSPVLPDRTWVEIDRGALRHNLRAMQKLAGKAGIMAVVKANAYGHGLEEVVRVLDGGVEVFAVASLGEALQLRRILKRVPILLLSAALPEEYPEIARRGFIPTISTSKEAALYAITAPKGAPVHFKVDTGMGRLGAQPADAIPTLRAIIGAGLGVHSISTHLSSADSDEKTTRDQLATFADLLDDLHHLAPEASIHALNSAGAMQHASEEGDLIRIGLALYGVSPLPAFQKLLRPVLSWKARINFLNDIPKGQRISYGGTFTAPRAMKIAILPAGYADGYPRQVSGKGAEVLIRGNRCPVIGRVTMDQIIVDVSKVKGVRVGDEAVLVGKQKQEELTATEIAAKADTIPWHLFCGITGRVAYRYIG